MLKETKSITTLADKELKNLELKPYEIEAYLPNVVKKPFQNPKVTTFPTESIVTVSYQG